MNIALISIIIPAYNRAHVIRDTLESVLAQTYTHWECIVVDDGCTDNTALIVNEYVAKDPRFRYYVRPLEHLPGGNGARNFGVARSKGGFIIFLDSDDLLLQGCLKNRSEIFNDESFDMLIHHTGVFYNEIGDTNLIWNKINTGNDNDALLERFFNTDIVWSTTGVTWSKRYFNLIGGWDETLSAWQDWELHVRALTYDPKCLFNCGKPDNYWRRDTKASIGSTNTSKAYMEALQRIVVTVGRRLKNTNIDSERVKDSFRHFADLVLIKTPIERGYSFLPLKMLILPRFTFSRSRWQFLWIYVVQLMGKNGRIRRVFIDKAYKKQQKLFVKNSTHLQLTIDDLKV